MSRLERSRLTAYINWPLIASIYPDLPYSDVGLILANQPWSGAYSVGESLDITGGSTANGALIEEWTCTGGANQQWLAVNGELVNPASGKCLDDPGFNTAQGTQLDLWTCNGGSNQQWSVP